MTQWSIRTAAVGARAARVVAGRWKASVPRPRRAMSSDAAAEADAQLMSLHEVSLAADLVKRGRRAEAAPLLERAVEICAGSMGGDSALARAAVQRLAVVLFDDRRFEAAESVLSNGPPGADKGSQAGAPALLLLSRAQLYQGKVHEAVATCSRAVDLCQQDEGHTPDTEALGQALRQLGAIQMLQGADEDAETSLLRAARLGSTAADQIKGLSVVAAFNASQGGEQSVEEAVELWKEACAAGPEKDGAADDTVVEPEGNSLPIDTDMESEEAASDDAVGSEKDRTFRLARASVLCASSQGDMLLGRGTTTASERLGEALKIREELLPTGHPATLWTLALLGRCHLLAGEAVTAEGLFRAALDGLEGFGGDEGVTNGSVKVQPAASAALHPSALHPYTRAAALRLYSDLLSQWEKREAEADVVDQLAEKVQSTLPLKPPGELTMHMLHLDDVY